MSRPDELLYIIAYYLLFGGANLFTALILVLVAIPETYRQQGNTLDEEVFLLALISGFFVLLFINSSLCSLGLLLAHPLWGRAATLIFSTILLLMSLFSIPVLLIEGFNNTDRLPIGAAIVISLASLTIMRYLTQPSIRSYFGEKTG